MLHYNYNKLMKFNMLTFNQFKRNYQSKPCRKEKKISKFIDLFQIKI